jgi:hypothetical protein
MLAVDSQHISNLQRAAQLLQCCRHAVAVVETVRTHCTLSRTTNVDLALVDLLTPGLPVYSFNALQLEQGPCSSDYCHRSSLEGLWRSDHL